MEDCKLCGKRFGHHDWCEGGRKAVILDRDWTSQRNPYEIPMSTIYSELESYPGTGTGSSKRFPTKFRNAERYYRPQIAGNQYYEYVYNPDHDLHTGSRYDYSAQRRNRANGPDPGYGRIITDQNKKYQGFSRHPYISSTQYSTELNRMDERWGSRSTRKDRVFSWSKNSDGVPKVEYVYKPWVERISRPFSFSRSYSRFY